MSLWGSPTVDAEDWESGYARPIMDADDRESEISDDYDSEENAESETDPDDEEEGLDSFIEGLHSIKKKTAKVSLNYGRNYQPNWFGKEAFREFYQNWRDGIMKSFHNDLSDFHTETQTTKRAIVIRALNPARKRPMGYIRFKWNKDKLGTLELVNFKASLDLKHLVIGGDKWKAGDEEQTGEFGEGMKVAALVMRRQTSHHTVRILSSEFTWDFDFNSHGVLECKLTRKGEEAVRRLTAADEQRQRAQRPRPLKPNIWEDVAVQIGSCRKGNVRSKNTVKSEWARMKSHKIRLDDFREWLAVTLDINPPTDIVRTPHGDLLLDERYNNKTFLKGLLLPQPTVSGKVLKHGYNFVSGETNRDRLSMVCADEEAETIAKIWGAALNTDGEILSEDSLVSKYKWLLENSFGGHENYGDVCDADFFASYSTAEKVWKYMLNPINYRDNKPPFYYFPTGGIDEKIIRDCLNCEPVQIEKRLWDMFHEKGLCHTPDKERYHRFHKAEESDLLTTTCFAKHIPRALAACLKSEPAISDIKLKFVRTGELGLDVIYLRGERTWKINDK